MKKPDTEEYFKGKSLDNLIEKLELPSNIRAYTSNNEDKGKKKNLDVSEFLDGFSFRCYKSFVQRQKNA